MSKKTLFLIGLLIELILIFGLFAPYEYRIATGKEIVLQTIPVDPRSLFRGDYVILDYEIGQDLPVEEYGKTMYFILEQQGDVFNRIGYAYEKPDLTEGQVCIRGVSEYGSAGFPSIAQYFVEEGLGKELEQARNNHRLLVHAIVDAQCNAVLTYVVLGAETTEQIQEPTFPRIPIPEAEVIN